MDQRKNSPMTPELHSKISELKKSAPRNAMLQLSLICFVILLIGALANSQIDVEEMFRLERRDNLKRFFYELRPWPVQKGDYSISGIYVWGKDLVIKNGIEAMLITLAMSICAIWIAATSGAVLSIVAAKLGIPQRRSPLQRIISALLIFQRSIPEYIWAFLLLSTFGPTVLPGILALGLHNAGVLGKLNTESLESAPADSYQAAISLGASPLQSKLLVTWPQIFPQYLSYVLYRFETCVRESAAIGILGLSTLGYWVEDARARNFYDQMIFYIALGVLIVVAADLFSTAIRSFLRLTPYINEPASL